jgi:hypothetical protein
LRKADLGTVTILSPDLLKIAKLWLRESIKETRNFSGKRNGEGRNRTADAGIFSPSLYRLSYLATFLLL